ncbi:MAG: Alanine racemase [Candidatus Uhrbacteria bacterium GW2011_GWD2_41_121]|uniref:Alanine racemase n=1 Tax=Candidatus Uhrbacteria bacterium GW2011_GWC1_41_20 TaxID=1618983 RepID=A0A0G0VDL8_9BACT|nr:MAG: Alanine racemase [Candidatus Uhrbacteria bacterium GW2011_GWE1_39_46]KKR63492.1 MAG: Alanine racemase [Candidatus Uhrbacteria bacterium GW2011_GWC2_40_450]KKR89706.1 MAG: Alanine racemase [Candidatus Uhrbacteria bacterium GW2011_GWD2_41_121]KKR95860.1 MAG: Alanine racemase [Candidatus Uhrbacteria bacterium GW2011_GWD1_41_16]KKR98993.1 MAG: Alanine racemase [Candidatus Uhrbacteria bacterium GW2011_GWC1_41_20]KKS17968.1 MAG: Alanine racemase [Candidatus Uhrbacteria bacterium GW2011_GWB1_
MKNLIIYLLRSRAKSILSKFNPKIVAITGSVGKTSAKEAIALVLSAKYKVRTAKKNYNNEFGVPLTILGEKSPGKNPFGWLALFWRSYWVKDFPQVLVLEYGIDKPGDMDKLCALARPNVAVVTGISTVHAANFQSVHSLAGEKAKLAQCVLQGGCVILNEDDEKVRAMEENANERVVKYGSRSIENTFNNMELETRVDAHFSVGETFIVTRSEITISGEVYGTLELNNMIGYAPLMSALCALTVARQMDVNVTLAMQKITKELCPVPGRLNPIAGIKGSLIIDDSYNAAPAAMQNGLEALRAFTLLEGKDRKIAALGQMAELGQYTKQEHRLIGMKVAEVADVFVAVGESMRVAVEAAEEAGMYKEAIEWFATSEEAGRYLDREIQEGDIVYVKGSQSSRMERVVKDLMAEPLRASELLVRQEEKWLRQ